MTGIFWSKFEWYVARVLARVFIYFIVAKVFWMVLAHGCLVILWHFFFFFSFLWNSWSVHGNNLVSWNKPEYYDITAAMHKGLRVKDVEECDEIRKCNCTVEIYRDYCVPWVTHCRVPCQCLSSVLFSEVILSLCSLCFHSFLPLLSFSMYLTDQTLGLSQFELCNVFFCLCRH